MARPPKQADGGQVVRTSESRCCVSIVDLFDYTSAAMLAPMRIQVFLALWICASAALGREGMWQPAQIPLLADQLTDDGLKLNPQQLSDLTGDPLRAIVQLSGCSASFVSAEGLVATNHHCAYGSIQYNSTAQKNLLRDGFLARTRADELPAEPSARVFVTVSMTDVTADFDRKTRRLKGARLFDAVQAEMRRQVALCEQDPGHRCDVYSFFGGSQYQLVKRMELRDVRLVYAPAEAIGKFGGDVDNWMWPRHTGDFALYRAYVGTDGKPAAYAKGNQPYKPKAYLSMAQDHLEAGDFVFIAGYPGRTFRHLSLREFQTAREFTYPRLIELYTALLQTIDASTRDRPDAAVKLAGTQAGLNNTLKNAQGMLENFRGRGIEHQRAAREQVLKDWIAADSERSNRYGKAFATLDAVLDELAATRERDYYYDFPQRAGFGQAGGNATSSPGRSQLLNVALTAIKFAIEQDKPDNQRGLGFQERDRVRIEASFDQVDRRYDELTDRALWLERLKRYHALPEDQRVTELDAALMLKPGEAWDQRATEQRLEAIYASSRLSDAAARRALIASGTTLADLRRSTDAFVMLALKLTVANERLEAEQREREGRLLAARREVMAALIAYGLDQAQPVYPDANGSLRLTTCKVDGYQPRDAVSMLPFTTLAGVVAKESGQEPFASPSRLLEAAAALHALPRGERAQRYAQVHPLLADVPVNFLATCDIVGGNSGSAMLDAHGRWIGLAFDGNHESIASSWYFDGVLSRTIGVGTQYLDFVLEHVEGATELRAELGHAPVSD